MPHMNSLGIFLRTLLLLAALLVGGCVRPDPNPTPTPSPAEPTPSPTSTATPTATPTWPAPATPIPTGTPRPPSSAGEGPTARRFVFILDNSNSLLEDCFSVDQVPTHSEPRAAMRDMTVFVVELLGELSRAAEARGVGQLAPLEIGIYAMHPYQTRRELVAVQAISQFEPGWDEPLAALLDFHHVDKFGWDVDWLDDEGAPVQLLASEPGVENRVILITDGYTGEPPTPQAPANPTADVGVERSSLVRDIEQLTQPTPTPTTESEESTQPTPESVENRVVSFNVVRFACPNLAENPTFEGDHKYLWQVLKNDKRIQLYDLELPRSDSELDYDRARAWQSFETVVQALLKEFEGTALWPPQMDAYDGANRLVGYGWLPTASTGPAAASSGALSLPTVASPALLPGNTASFALRLVTASPGQAGYSVVFRRDGRMFRYPLNYVNSGHVYAIDPADHALRDVLSVQSDICAPIEWWLEGPVAPAFGWWSTEPARYTIEAELTSAAAFVNNAPIGVGFQVDEILAEPGHADCYEVRVRLGTTNGAGELLHTRPLRQLYPSLRGSHVFDYYPFIPLDHEGLVVNVDLVESLNRAAGDLSRPGDPAQRVVMDAEKQLSVENEYVPWFNGTAVVYNDGCRTDEAEEADEADEEEEEEEEETNSPSPRAGDCYFEIKFDFADENYWPGDVPEPAFYALNLLAPGDVGVKTMNDGDNEICKNLGAILNEEPQSQSDGEQKYRSGQLLKPRDSAKQATYATTYEEVTRPNAPGRVFQIGLISDAVVATCGYEAILIAWPEHEEWPAVLCEQSAYYNVTCRGTDMDWK